MFCNQCEQTAGGKGCTKVGVCGKIDEVAHIQDGLILSLRQLASTMIKADAKNVIDQDADDLILYGLFSTLTNVNFDAPSLKELIARVLRTRACLAQKLGCQCDPDKVSSPEKVEALLSLAPNPTGFAENDDVRSAMQIILFGLKGVAAYGYHAARLNQRDHAMIMTCCRLLCAGPDDGRSRDLNDWLGLVLECGGASVRVMQLLDAGNTETFGDPEPTTVTRGHRAGPCILVTGHDLPDLLNLLKQTEGKGISIYTHGEMLPAHAYPALKAFPHFVGHFGTAWQNQRKEFPDFPGPVLFTTNCIQNPQAYMDHIFTCGPVRWPGCTNIADDDFTPIIEKAIAMKGYASDEEGTTITTGFGRAVLTKSIPAIIDAVKQGALRHVFLVGGCDGIRATRSYYEKFVEKSPADTLVLTLACGKYRFIDKNLGKIGDFPRIIDAGQCNDAYSAVVLALELSKALGCTVNDLPLSLVLSWYEQKAVAVLLALLHLGVKGIRLGPTLPAFVSPNILKALVDGFDLKPVNVADPEGDLADCLK